MQDITEYWVFLIIGFVVLLIIIMGILSTIRVLKEWERAPVFSLGRFSGIKGPGIIFRIPILQSFGQTLDLRLTTFAYNSESSLTADNVSVRVDAIMFYKIVNAETAILEVDNYHRASQWAAQTTLREVIGATELDTVLSHRDEVSHQLAEIIDHKTEKYGVKVTSVEIRDIILPGPMQEVMARQAIAEREKRARLTMASAENEASQMMLDAAKQYETSPTAFVLRYWNILKEISENPGTKLIIMPSAPENLGQGDMLAKIALGLDKTE